MDLTSEELTIAKQNIAKQNITKQNINANVDLTSEELTIAKQRSRDILSFSFTHLRPVALICSNIKICIKRQQIRKKVIVIENNIYTDNK